MTDHEINDEFKEQQSFRQDLEALLNRYSKENVSNTPDFIMAKFLRGCLAQFNYAVADRDRWYSVHLEPGGKSYFFGGNAGAPTPSIDKKEEIKPPPHDSDFS